MAKLLGYVLTLLGIIGIAAGNIPQLRSNIPLPSQVNDAMLLIGSAALVIIGLFFILKGGGRGKKLSEVPIFQGKNVVGFRRLGKR